MGQKWYFDGVSLCTHAWHVESVPSGLGAPPKRGENILIPYLDGRRNIPKQYAERTLPLGLWVRGADKDTGLIPAGKEYEKLLDNIDYLSSVFGRRGEKKLRRELPNGSIREASAEAFNPVDFPLEEPYYHARFTVDFLLADPLFYALTQTTETITPNATPHTWTHTNPGTAPSKKMVITLTGPLSSPKIENLTAGVWLQYTGDLLDGESVTIDTGTFTAEKGDGSNAIALIKHQGDPAWLVLNPEYNSMELTCSATPSGQIDIAYYAPYF